MNSESNAAVALPLGPEMIQRAQQGDADAFAAVFHAHKTRIYSLCLRMTNNVNEAEDLTQDAFLQVFRKLSTFRGASALSTWLYRIAVNTVLMHFRKKSPALVSQDETYSDNEGATRARCQHGSSDGRLEGSVTRLSLTRALSELPAGYRMIFLLHEVEGYQHREIAEMLGCSVGNSKSQLHKAKLQIRRLLTEGAEPGVQQRGSGRIAMIEPWPTPAAARPQTQLRHVPRQSTVSTGWSGFALDARV